MARTNEQLQKLIDIGNDFTYENFSLKSEHGYPNALLPEWVSWETRCRGLITSLFGKGSAQDNAMNTAMSINVIGWDRDHFERRRNHIVGVLQSTLEILKEDTFNELSGNKTKPFGTSNNKVFIVHGHDEIAKTSLEIFLKELGLEPVVLHRQADEGNTIIEKFEKHSNVGYAFVLLTPDERAFLTSETSIPEDERNIEFRARSNVIFEFGYFVGKLGRNRVCCLYKGDVMLPSDVSGLIYKKYQSSIEEAGYSIIKDLKAAGYSLV